MQPKKKSIRKKIKKQKSTGGAKIKKNKRGKSKLKESFVIPENEEKISVFVPSKKTTIQELLPIIEKNIQYKPSRLDILKKELPIDGKSKKKTNTELKLEISSILKYTPTYLTKITNPQGKRVITKFYTYLEEMDNTVKNYEKNIFQLNIKKETSEKQQKSIKENIKTTENMLKKVENRKTLFGYGKKKKKKEIDELNKKLNDLQNTLYELEQESKNITKNIDEYNKKIKNLITQTLKTKI